MRLHAIASASTDSASAGDDSGTMPASASPMNSRPKPALRAGGLAQRSSASRPPAARCRSAGPTPIGSAVVTTIQSRSIGCRAAYSASRRRRRALRSSCDRRRSARRAVRPWPRRTALRRCRGASSANTVGEQVRQIDLGVDLLHDLAVPLDAHVEVLAGKRGFPCHRFRRLRRRDGFSGSGGWRGRRRGSRAGGRRRLGRCHGCEDRRRRRQRCAGRRNRRRNRPHRHLGGRGRGLLCGFRLLLKLGGGELKPLHDAEEALIHFAPDALPLLGRHRVEGAVASPSLETDRDGSAQDRSSGAWDLVVSATVGPGGGPPRSPARTPSRQAAGHQKRKRRGPRPSPWPDPARRGIRRRACRGAYDHRPVLARQGCPDRSCGVRGPRDGSCAQCGLSSGGCRRLCRLCRERRDLPEVRQTVRPPSPEPRTSTLFSSIATSPSAPATCPSAIAFEFAIPVAVIVVTGDAGADGATGAAGARGFGSPAWHGR